jgi:hypothetical protein
MGGDRPLEKPLLQREVPWVRPARHCAKRTHGHGMLRYVDVHADTRGPDDRRRGIVGRAVNDGRRRVVAATISAPMAAPMPVIATARVAAIMAVRVGEGGARRGAQGKAGRA